jgi:hypothetical protein
MRHVPVRQLTQPTNKKIHHALNYKRENQDKNELGQFVLREVDEIVVPTALNRLEALFIWNGLEKCKKKKYGGVSLSLEILHQENIPY